jgi:outer membrane lipoprotein-sorting protein
MRKQGLFLFLFLLWCASCATLPREPSPAPLPEDFLARLRARSQALQGLKGLAHVRVSAPGKNFTTQEVIFARRPGFLRLETLSPLGTPLFYFATTGQDLSMYHPGENRFYQGPARARHLSAILPAGLEPEEVVAILLGGFPLLLYEDSSTRYDAREELWFLDLKAPSGGGRQTLGIDPQNGRILSAEYPLQGITRRLFFSEFKEASNFSFPHKIHFESPASRTQFTIEYQEVTLNPEWEEQDFHLPVPRGAQIVPLE